MSKVLAQAFHEIINHDSARTELSIEHDRNYNVVRIRIEVDNNYLDGIPLRSRESDEAHEYHRKLVEAIEIIRQAIKFKNENSRCFNDYK